MSSETPGKLLSAARESQSLSQADIAKQMRLSVQVINDIECDVYDRFGAATFVRGYLRNYARAVGVSEEKILATWEASDITAKLISPAPSVVKGVFTADDTHHQTASHMPSRTVMVVGALVVLSAIMWWENQDATPTVAVNTAQLALKPAAIIPAAAPVQVAAKTAVPTAVQPDTMATANVAAKHVKHTVVAHHHAEPLHVTYTLKPVSPEEVASDH